MNLLALTVSNSSNWKHSTEAMYDYITSNVDGITREDESLKDLFGKDILSALVGEAKKLKPAIKNMAYQMAAVKVGKPIRGICDNSVLLNVGGTVGNPACERLWMELEDISKKITDLNVIEPERYVSHDTSTGLLSTYSELEDQNSLSATTLTLGESVQTTSQIFNCLVCWQEGTIMVDHRRDVVDQVGHNSNGSTLHWKIAVRLVTDYGNNT